MIAARPLPIPASDEPDAGLRPAQYAVLGLLREAPSHGYDLQRSFSEGTELGSVVRIEQASLYATLRELASRGLIDGEETREGARPPRTRYTLSSKGARALEAWLGTPVQRLREVRLDFLLKVYFARRDGPERVQLLVDAQIVACHRYLSSLETRAAVLSPESFAYLVNESRSSAARGTLEWLRAYRRRL